MIGEDGTNSQIKGGRGNLTEQEGVNFFDFLLQGLELLKILDRRGARNLVLADLLFEIRDLAPQSIQC